MKFCAFWELELLGIKEKAEALRTVEERTVVPHVAEKLKFENRRYRVEMPWKECKQHLNNNFERSSPNTTQKLRVLSDKRTKNYETFKKDL